MPGCTAAWLPKCAQDRVARATGFNDRTKAFDLIGADILGRHALQRIRVGGAFVAAYLVFGLGQHHHAARAEHDVIVQVLGQILVK